jgi:hypothetical protein
MATKTSPCFEIVNSSNRLHQCAGRGCGKTASGTTVNSLAAPGPPCVGIRQITFDKTRQKFEHGLYYVKHPSPGLEQFFQSETIKTIVLRGSAQ